MLGMNRSTVFGWVTKYRQGDADALKAKPVPGRPPKLDGRQLQKLYTMIVGKDPRQLKFESALWTREMVREVIRLEFGVALSKVSVGRMLRKVGLPPQRPSWQATQQSPDAVKRWKEEEFPAIKAEVQRVGATIWFADEAGVRSDHHAGTTWAPVGQTPIVKSTRARHSVNMVSAVTAQGQLRFATYPGRFTADSFIDSCRQFHRLLPTAAA